MKAQGCALLTGSMELCGQLLTNDGSLFEGPLLSSQRMACS